MSSAEENPTVEASDNAPNTALTLKEETENERPISVLSTQSDREQESEERAMKVEEEEQPTVHHLSKEEPSEAVSLEAVEQIFESKQENEEGSIVDEEVDKMSHRSESESGMMVDSQVVQENTGTPREEKDMEKKEEEEGNLINEDERLSSQKNLNNEGAKLGEEEEEEEEEDVKVHLYAEGTDPDDQADKLSHLSQQSGRLSNDGNELSHRESETGNEMQMAHQQPESDVTSPDNSLVYTATPGMLFEQKEESLLRSHPLNINWALGLNHHLPVYTLQDGETTVLLYGCAHTAVIYDSQKTAQHILQGHLSAVSCLCISEDRRWAVTADKGHESLVIIWDTFSGIPVQTLFDCHPGEGVEAMAMTPDAKYLVTVSAGAVQEICIWDWTSDREGPICSTKLHPDCGTHILFNPSDYMELISNSESQVVFYSWHNQQLEYETPSLTEKTFNKVVGSLSQSIYHFKASQALSATSAGNVVIWDVVRMSAVFKPHNKKAIKLMHLQKEAITVLTLCDSYIVTGDVKGHIKFYDEQLRLINWFSRFNLASIHSICFSTEPPNPQGKEDYLKDCTISASQFIVRNFVVLTAEAKVVHISASGTHMETLLYEHWDTLHAVACHPVYPLVAMGSYCGLLNLWNYKLKKNVCSRIFKNDKEIQSLTFDLQGSLLAVGFVNGAVYILDALTLTTECEEPFKFAKGAITHMAFSGDSQYLATADSGFVVTVFKLSPKNGKQSWELIGRHRSHYKTIQDIMFVDDLDGGLPRLLSLGMDQFLVEYDLTNSSKDDLRILASDRIEQSAVPYCMTVYPAITKENFILTANDQFKMKLYNSTTKMCRKTQLGPTYGSPIKKMQVLPGTTDTESSVSYLAYITNDKIGLQILPVDGNPHRSSALICHAEGVSSFTCSCDGKYIFTAGGEDCIVYLWETNLNALEAAATLGGKDLDPFYELINGGRDGELFRELEDYFYYCQIRCQGIDCMEPRQVSTTIPLSEVPFVMRALGFYPTEQEIEDMQNEVKFSEYVNTGKYVTEVDIGEFLKLFINHRPAFGISRYEVQKAFEFLGYDQENGEHVINRKELLQLLQSRGEHLTEEDLAEYFSTLLGLNPEGGRFEPGYVDIEDSEALLESGIPDEITADMFTADILGLPVYVIEPETSEEQLTDRDSSLS
ncbi:CF251 protein, partial [Polypterus senegalus]|nr:CF251 protein [Polypterus senegalus]